MQGFDHAAQQVDFELWMHRANPGRVIRIAMMALGENIDRVNLAHLQGFNESLRIELRSHTVAFQGSMEIQVDLAKAVVCFLHGFLWRKKLNVL
jgi:hypothetical protein